MLEYSEGHTGVAHRHLGRNHQTPPSPSRSPQRPTADGAHSQADHHEGMVEDSWGTLEHGAWNTQRPGLLSQLQLVLQRANNHRIHIHKEARHQLLDLQLLAQDLAIWPTRIAEVLPQ